MVKKSRTRKRSPKREPNSLEMQVIKECKRRKTRKTRVEYETERLPYYLTRSYIPDVVVVFPSGRKLYIEAKGWLRPADRTKMISVKKANPNLDIRFVFSKDNTLGRGSKTRYSDWCLTNGFPYHVGTDIPKEWFDDF